MTTKTSSTPKHLLNLGVAVAAVSATAWYVKKKRDEKYIPKTLDLRRPEEKYSLKLIRKDIISHDTRKFVFELPSEKHVLGLPIGKHIFLSATINGQLVVRPYTPVTSDEDKGHVDLVIKVYFRNRHPSYPDGGKMSQYLENLPIGECVHVRGPGGLVEYTAKGTFIVRYVKEGLAYAKRTKQIAMIAGGTGITPMLQLIRQCLKDVGDKTKLWLLYANKTEQDILVRKELEECAAAYPKQFQLWYTLDTPPKDWTYSSGFISQEMIEEQLPPPSIDCLVLMCGPPVMVQRACLPNLKKAGHQECRLVTF